MKKMIMAMLLALSAQAQAESLDCTGLVTRLRPDNAVGVDSPSCTAKWGRSTDSALGLRLERRILRTCPLGSTCHVTGTYSNHGIEEITSVRNIPNEPPCATAACRRNSLAVCGVTRECE